MKYFLYLSLFFVAACDDEKAKEQVSATLSQEQQLLDALRQFPDSTLMVENAAQYYREREEYTKSLSVVDDAIKRDSTRFKYWYLKGRLHYENADTVRAIQALETSTRLSKDLSSVLLLAKFYAETKNPASLELSEWLIKQQEFIKEAILIKGIYYNSINQNEKAIEFFDEAIGTSYTFMESYREKAKVLYSEEKYMDALIVLDKALKVKNTYAEGYYYMGLCFEKLGRLEDAKESYETTLIYDSEFEIARDALQKLQSVN